MSGTPIKTPLKMASNMLIDSLRKSRTVSKGTVRFAMSTTPSKCSSPVFSTPPPASQKRSSRRSLLFSDTPYLGSVIHKKQSHFVPTTPASFLNSTTKLDLSTISVWNETIGVSSPMLDRTSLDATSMNMDITTINMEDDDNELDVDDLEKSADFTIESVWFEESVDEPPPLLPYEDNAQLDARNHGDGLEDYDVVSMFEIPDDDFLLNRTIKDFNNNPMPGENGANMISALARSVFNQFQTWVGQLIPNRLF